MRRLSIFFAVIAVAGLCLAGFAQAEPSPLALDCFPPSETPWLDEGPTDPNHTVGSVGALRGAVVFVDFSDKPQTETTNSYYDRFAPVTASTFDNLSYGKLDLTLSPTHKWYRMSKPSTEYGFDRSNFTFAAHRAFMSEVISLADPDVDFSQFDFLVVAASKRAAVDGTAFIAANPGDETTADGKAIRFAVTVEERNADLVVVPGFGSPVLIHETTHLFGIPDLYNNQDPYFDDAGTWDYMAQPEPVVPGLFGWHKWKLGWFDDAQVLCQVGAGSIETTLSPVSVAGGNKMVVVRTGPTHAYAVEVRQPIGTDARLCDKGVLVYSVDTSRMSGSDPSAVQIKPAQPDDPGQRGTCGWRYNAPFDVESGEVATFEDATDGVKVEVLSAVGNDFNVRVTFSGVYTPPKQSHARTAPTFAIKKHLVASGTLSAPDGFTSCIGGVKVQIQRKSGSSWKPVKSVTTSSSGAFSVKIPDATGTYRASAKAVDLSTVHSCGGATSVAKKHIH